MELLEGLFEGLLELEVLLGEVFDELLEEEEEDEVLELLVEPRLGLGWAMLEDVCKWVVEGWVVSCVVPR